MDTSKALRPRGNSGGRVGVVGPKCARGKKCDSPGHNSRDRALARADPNAVAMDLRRGDLPGVTVAVLTCGRAGPRAVPRMGAYPEPDIRRPPESGRCLREALLEPR